MSTACMPTPDDRQLALFQESPTSSPWSHQVTATASGRRFRQGDAKAIFLGMTPLEDHLHQAGIVAPFFVADLLDAQDWTPQSVSICEGKEVSIKRFGSSLLLPLMTTHGLQCKRR